MSKKRELDLDVVLGFSDELEKISKAIGSFKPFGIGELKKSVSTFSKKPSYSKVHSAPAPGHVGDPLESLKISKPPPVTVR